MMVDVPELSTVAWSGATGLLGVLATWRLGARNTQATSAANEAKDRDAFRGALMAETDKLRTRVTVCETERDALRTRVNVTEADILVLKAENDITKRWVAFLTDPSRKSSESGA